MDELEQKQEDLEPRVHKRSRSPIVGVVVLVMATWLLWTLREPTAYFFRARRPVELGQAPEAVEKGLLRANTFVRVQGMPDRRHTTVIEGRWGRYKGLFPLARTRDALWVAEPRKGRQPREEFPEALQGRLVPFSSQPFFPDVLRYYAEKMTTTYDFEPREFLHQLTGAAGRLRARSGRQVDISKDRAVFVGVTFPGDFRVQFDLARYPDKAASDALLSEMDMPFVDLPESGAFRAYFVRADDGGKRLFERFSDISQKVSVIPRSETFAAHFGDLAAQDQTLVLAKTQGQVPAAYTAAEGALVPNPQPLPLRLPSDRISSIEVTAPFQIPAGAFVLLEAETPGSYWPFFAMDAVLVAVVIGNFVVFGLRLRRRNASAA